MQKIGETRERKKDRRKIEKEEGRNLNATFQLVLFLNRKKFDPVLLFISIPIFLLSPLLFRFPIAVKSGGQVKEREKEREKEGERNKKRGKNDRFLNGKSFRSRQ